MPVGTSNKWREYYEVEKFLNSYPGASQETIWAKLFNDQSNPKTSFLFSTTDCVLPILISNLTTTLMLFIFFQFFYFLLPIIWSIVPSFLLRWLLILFKLALIPLQCSFHRDCLDQHQYQMPNLTFPFHRRLQPQQKDQFVVKSLPHHHHWS